ncbi:Ubiquitin carboxyl-terminal hydrolase [Handroanthus impetiginosus]|uniref:ubiquitinyl hydrolase 1 n=1 Tax=Handroanthus impetiginosus TaxID=429701 RepID=A0A2G9I8F2_9LAMI|nr:Ubiquitin carboxyl-terminal hydrolase [Handroanthus impetiginosus]
MLLEGSLKLLCSVVVVVVGWFFARRKWRQYAAWKEEVRRRMAFAREEGHRLELEAAAGYGSYGYAPAPEPTLEEPVFGPGRQFQRQCKICFSPTTTRCKQCKAVHYCSRECQKLHWRQGHKKECHLFTPHGNTDVGIHSCLKESKQDDIQSTQDVMGKVTHTIKSVESFSGEHMFSDPIAHVLSENNGTETETIDDGKITEINVKAPVRSLPDECSSSDTSSERSVASGSNLKDCDRYDGQGTPVNVESMKPLSSVHPSLPNDEYHEDAANVSKPLNSGSADTDKKSDSSTSSGCDVAVPEEGSLSEPSTPSDFFGGTVETIRSKIDALDEFGSVNISDFRSSYRPTSGRINGNVEILGSEMNRVLADDPLPAKSMPRKSTALSEVSEDGLKSGGLSSLNCKLSSQTVVRNTPIECSSKKEAKLSSSNACGEQITEGHVRSNHVANVSSLSSLAPKQLPHEIDLRNGILESMNCKGNDSLRIRSSEAHLSSASLRKPAILDAQSVEDGSDQGEGACSLGSNGYVQSARSGTNPSVRRLMDHHQTGAFIGHGSLGAGSGIMERYEGSFRYKLFVELYNWKMVELCPSGLINCGNSCYANAVLQCLAFTPPLTAYFLQGLHSKACKEKDWCFTCEFETLVKKAKAGISPLSPERIMSQIRRIGSCLVNGRQEDAHEFLGYAIKAMQYACLKEAGVAVPSSLAERTTLLGLTFGGYLQSKIDCTRCESRSRKNERIMDLTVEIGGEIGTLEDALNQFTQPEDLDGENKYYCSRCKSHVKAKKKLGILEAPNVLTIVLKRFQSGEFGKLNKAVKYPEVLNLGSYMSGSDTSPVYQLYGVVVHIDVMNATSFGHYVCYVKNKHKKWFKADDSKVEAVDVRKVLSADAYMLFYARCSPRAPKLLRSSMLKPKNPTSSKSKPHPWGNVLASRLRSSSLDSSSEYSSSPFSDAGSFSTEGSSKRASSASTDDYLFDQMLGGEISDLDRCYSSDAETTSSSGSVNI